MTLVLRLYYGDDRVSMDAAVRELTARLEPSTAAANLTRFDGATADLSEVAAACQSMPFLGELRLVLVERLGERLKAVGREAASEFVRSASSLPPTTDLVAIEPELKGDGSAHPLFAEAQRSGEVKCFSLGGAESVEQWIARRAQEVGAEISREAGEELHRRVGDDALQLRSELDKLITYCLGEGRIELQDVRQMVPASVQSSVFDLVDAIGRKQAARALELVQGLLVRQSEPAAVVLAMIGRQFRLLVMAKELLSQRASPGEMAAELQVPAWLVRRLVEQSRHFAMPELERALERTLYADYATKGGGDMPEASVLTQLVADLTLEPQAWEEVREARSPRLGEGP